MGFPFPSLGWLPTSVAAFFDSDSTSAGTAQRPPVEAQRALQPMSDIEMQRAVKNLFNQIFEAEHRLQTSLREDTCVHPDERSHIDDRRRTLYQLSKEECQSEKPRLADLQRWLQELNSLIRVTKTGVCHEHLQEQAGNSQPVPDLRRIPDNLVELKSLHTLIWMAMNDLIPGHSPAAMRLRQDAFGLLDQLSVFDPEPDSVPHFQRVYAQIHAMGTTARALQE